MARKPERVVEDEGPPSDLDELDRIARDIDARQQKPKSKATRTFGRKTMNDPIGG